MIPPETTSKETTDMTTAGGASERSQTSPGAAQTSPGAPQTSPGAPQTSPSASAPQPRPTKSGHGVTVKDLHAYYGKGHVVQGISLRVDSGEAVGLVGRNGAGKTTTLKAIAGLLKQVTGSIRIDGVDVGSKPAHARAQASFADRR